MKKYIYAILLVLLVGCEGSGGGADHNDKDTAKQYYILNGNDTIYYKGDSLFVLDTAGINAWLRSEDSMTIVDTIIVTDN